MYNITLTSSSRQMSGTMIDLENLRIEEPEEEEEKEPDPEQKTPEETPTPQESPVRTHQAYNQNQKEKNENFESRLNEIFEKNSAKSTAAEEEASEATQGEFKLNKKNREKSDLQSDGDNTSDNTSTRSGNIRDSSISFSLKGRGAVDIPNPIYTCDTSGKVVVNITVNARGLVTKTSINKGSSTSTNECLTNKAREYAAEAVFSELPGRDSQIGTITYNFQGQ